MFVQGRLPESEGYQEDDGDEEAEEDDEEDGQFIISDDEIQLTPCISGLTAGFMPVLPELNRDEDASELETDDS